jgi:hypothetical protein
MALNPEIILEASRNMPNFGATIVAGQEIARKREAENAATERANKFASLQQTKPQGVSMTDWLSSQGYATEAADLAKTEAETAKLQAEGSVKQQDAHAKMIEVAGKATQELLGRPDLNKDVVRQTFDAYHKAGLTSPEMYQKQIGSLATLPDDPAQLRQHIESQAMALQSAKDQMGYLRPDANAQLSANTQMRGQDLTYGMNQQELGFNREKFGQEYGLKQGEQAFDQQYKGAQLGLDRDKYQLDEYKAKNPQGSGAVTPNQRRMDADAVISILNQAEPLLEGSTSSMIGAGVDAAAGAFGYSMPGAQNSAQLRALEGALISKMPKMSGPQSDKDVLLYKQMAGQIGDSTLPIETRRAAMKTIRTLNEQYASPEPRQHGATISWDDSKIDEFVSKNGGTPEKARAFLKSKGLL